MSDIEARLRALENAEKERERQRQADLERRRNKWQQAVHNDRCPVCGGHLNHLSGSSGAGAYAGSPSVTICHRHGDVDKLYPRS